MKHLRRTCAALLLASAVSAATFAGETRFPGATGDTQFPGATGEIGFPGATGDTSGPSLMGEILTPGIRLLFATLM